MVSNQAWDADGYDASFSFVTSYGAALLDLLEARPGERVLDLGCGTGHQAGALADLGAVVVGVDSDAAMLDVARAAHPGPSFVLADAQDVDALRAAVGDPVDAVLSNAALHWMARQDDVVGAIASVLRPGGRVVGEMGGAGNVARLTDAIRVARASIGLDRDLASSWTFPTPGEQATRLERCGLTVHLVQAFARSTALAPGDTAASWAAMFGAALVADVPRDRRAEFDAALDTRATGLGLASRPDGEPGWWADYVRLRFVAVREPR